ncbi:MAG: DUF3368 domain-containing protein [Thermoplasmata archaeon]
MYVLNATPVIYLAKAGRIQLLKELDRRCVIPGSVYEEVVTRGKEQGEIDALKIERCLNNHVLEVMEAPKTPLSRKLAQIEWLDVGERDVLVIAGDSGAKAILDDKLGRQIAEAEDIDYGGSIYLLIQLVKKGVTLPSDMRDTVDVMIRSGWFCSTELYAEIIKKIHELE